MNKIITLLLLGVLWVPKAWAATAYGTGSISARIVAPHTGKHLNFGDLKNKAGVVSVSPNGKDSSTGKVLIYGAANQLVHIGMINDTTLTSKNASMKVTNFQTDKMGPVTLTKNDGYPVKVGAKLMVNDNQKSGVYAGTYTLTVTY